MRSDADAPALAGLAHRETDGVELGAQGCIDHAVAEAGSQGAKQGGVVSGVAGRYASALFELAQEKRALDAVARDLDAFDAMIRDSEDLRRLIRSPVFSAEEQEKAVTAILAAAGIGGLAGNFIRLVASNRRLFALPDMIRAYRALVAEHKGIVRAQVTLEIDPLDHFVVR